MKKLLSGNYTSRAIARAFKEAGIIERYGSGIARINTECKAHEIKEPLFEEFVHGFRVILYKEKIQNINVGVNEIYEFIKLHQPIKAKIIAENFTNVTQRTIER